MKSTVIINGVSYQGSSVAIRGSRIIIDGKEQESMVAGVVEVRVVEGTLDRLDVPNGNVTVQGPVQGSISASNITCHDVGGNVHGSVVNCKDVRGSVSATVVNRM